MAITKTFTYQPFQEALVGYGATEIADNYSSTFTNDSSQVCVEIVHKSGPFGKTGHISTPSSNDTVSSIVKAELAGTEFEIWKVQGAKTDVDAILHQLKFYPADYPQSRPYDAVDNPAGWRNDLDTYKMKINKTSGNYGSSENPPLIPNTEFEIIVKDPTNNYDVVDTGYLTANPVNLGIVAQRPFFSVEGTGEMSGIPDNVIVNGVIGGNYNFGTVANTGYEQDQVTVSVEVYDYHENGGTVPNSTTIIVEGYDATYVNDKIPNPSVPAGTLFEFTGDIYEIQSFLDSVRLRTSSNQKKTIITRTKIQNIDIGSYFDTVTWFPQDLVPTGYPPNYPVNTINTPEDQTVILAQNPSLGFDLANMPEVNEYSITITFDSSAQSAILNAWETDDKLATIDTSTTYVKTSTSSFASVIQAHEQIILDLQPDYFGSFTYTVVYKAFNTDIGSEYTYTNVVTVNVADVPEYSWTDPGVISWNKNEPKDFDSGLRITDNALSGTAQYKLQVLASTFTNFANSEYSYANEGFSSQYPESGFSIRPTNDTGITWNWVDQGNGYYYLEITGSRSEINSVLASLSVIPPVDWLQPTWKDPAYVHAFWVDFKVERLSFPAVQIDFADTPVVTFAVGTDTADWNDNGTNPYPIDWEKNMAAYWDSGIVIEDIAYEHPWYNRSTDYQVKLRPFYTKTDLTTAWFNEVEVSTTSVNVTKAYNIVNGEVTFTGTKSQVNEALENLCMTPDANFLQPADANETWFFFDIEITRLLDNTVILPYPDTPANVINWGTDADAFVMSDTSLFMSMLPQETFYQQNTPNFQLRQIVDPKQALNYYIYFTLNRSDILPYVNGNQIGSGAQTYVAADYVDTGYIEETVWAFSLSHPNPNTLNQMLRDVYFIGNISNPNNNVEMGYWVYKNGELVQNGYTLIEELISADNFTIETRDSAFTLNDPAGLRGEFEDYQMFVDTDLALGTDYFDTMVVNYSDTATQPGTGLYVYNPEGDRIVKTSWQSGLEAIVKNEVAVNVDGSSAYVNKYLLSDSVHDTVEKRFVFEPEKLNLGGAGIVSSGMYNDMLGYWEETKFRFGYTIPGGTDPVYTKTKKQFVTKISPHQSTVRTLGNETQFIPNLSTGKSTCIRMQTGTGSTAAQAVANAPYNEIWEYDTSGQPNAWQNTDAGPLPTWNMSNTTAPMGLVSRKSDMGILVCCHDSPDFLNNAPSPYNSQFGNSPAQDTFITISGQPLNTNPTKNGWQSANLSNTTSIVVGISGSGSDWKNNPQSIGDVLVDDDAGYVYFTACSSSGSGVMIVRQAITSADTVDTSSDNMRKIDLTTAANMPLDTRKQIAANSFKLGKLSDGTIVSCMGDIFSSHFRMVHYDPTSRNITHSEIISRTNWATSGSSNFNTFFAVPGTGGSQWEVDANYVQLNLDGYAILGPYLYRWNGTNWEEAYAEPGVSNSNQLLSTTSLGDGVFIINGGEFKRIGHPNGDANTVYGTGVVPTETLQDRFRGHRRSKAFLSRDYIYRFAT